MEDSVIKNRHKYIGGSDVPTLFKINKFKSLEDLKAQYINFYKNSTEFINNDSEYTIYGHLLEPRIRDYINDIKKYNFEPKSILFEDLNIRCNCDGIDVKTKTILEIKTNSGNHRNTFDYELQAQLYMWAFDCNKAIIAMYKRPKNFYSGISVDFHKDEKYFNLEFNIENLTIKEIERKDRIIEEILNKISKFWKDVRNGQQL